MNNKTIQIRIKREIHKKLKLLAIEENTTITELASRIVTESLENKTNHDYEIPTIEF
jgi:hypothetical protein